LIHYFGQFIKVQFYTRHLQNTITTKILGRDQAKIVKRLLGISCEQLEQLIEKGKMLHQIKQDKKEKVKTRMIKAGGGKPSKCKDSGQKGWK
jgi:hypothetical protein